MLSNIRDGPFTGEVPDEGARCRRLSGRDTRRGVLRLSGWSAFRMETFSFPGR